MKLVIRTLSLVLLLPAMANADAEQNLSLERVTEILTEKWDGIEGFAATMRIKVKVKKGMVSAGSELEGPILYTRDHDGSPRYRSHMTGKVGGGPLNMLSFNADVLTVNTGDTLFTETTVMGKTKVRQAAVEHDRSDAPGGGGSRLKKMQEQYDFTVLPSGTLGNRPVYVIQGKRKPDAGKSDIGAETVLLYFDRETGMQLHMAALNESGKPLMEVSFLDVRLNPEVKEGAFDYTPPPGVEVEVKEG